MSAARSRPLSRPLWFSIAALAAIVTLGTVGYVLIEGWPVADALWMVVITLTTIGYEEVHPLSNAGRILTVALVAAGVGVGAYAVTRITQVFLEGDFTRALRERRRRRMVKNLSGHTIVVGHGRLGASVVCELVSAGHPVCVVDRDARAVEELEAEGKVPVIVGDGADDAVLKQAGIDRAQTLAVAVSGGAEAIYVTLSARGLRPDLYILTRVEDPDTGIKARRAGANGVISPHLMGGWRMAHGLIRPHASSLLDLAVLGAHKEFLFDELEVPSDSALVGNSLGDLRVRDRFDVLVVGVRQADGELVVTPKGSQPIAAGDVLIVMGSPAGVRRLQAALTR